MKWINVRDKLPRSEKPVWIYWRDQEVLIGWYTYYGKEREEREGTDLANEGWYSTEHEKCRYTNWWMPIEPKPEPPEEE